MRWRLAGGVEGFGVDPVRAGAAVGVLEGDGALEHVVLLGRWEGTLHI